MKLAIPLEIERKFLVNLEHLPVEITGIDILQGYLHTSQHKTIRVRISGELAHLTIKGPDNNGVRPEFEYSIPLRDARFMMDQFCDEGKIEKIRRRIEWSGKIWEIDEFLGENKGLWLAEIELKQRNELVDFPPWIGDEVTGDNRYHNSFLSSHPFSGWK